MDAKPRAFSPVVSATKWTDKERKVWAILLFIGCLLVSAGRGALPVTVVEMSKEFQWDKRMSVSAAAQIWQQLLSYVYQAF